MIYRVISWLFNPPCKHERQVLSYGTFMSPNNKLEGYIYLLKCDRCGTTKKEFLP